MSLLHLNTTKSHLWVFRSTAIILKIGDLRVEEVNQILNQMDIRIAMKSKSEGHKEQ